MKRRRLIAVLSLGCVLFLVGCNTIEINGHVLLDDVCGLEGVSEWENLGWEFEFNSDGCVSAYMSTDMSPEPFIEVPADIFAVSGKMEIQAFDIDREMAKLSCPYSKDFESPGFAHIDISQCHKK